jgi:hypothetical protein
MVVRPAARGQDAVAVIAEKDGVDQFRLAARELGDEGDDQLVLAQALEQLLQAQFALRVASSFSASQPCRASRFPETASRHLL